MRSSGGTGTAAIMYLYIIACLSSSFHCAFVKGNPKDDDDVVVAILPVYTHHQKHTTLILIPQYCLRQNHLYSLSLSLINKYNFAMTLKRTKKKKHRPGDLEAV
jgi:hypothetical protein